MLVLFLLIDSKTFTFVWNIFYISNIPTVFYIHLFLMDFVSSKIYDKLYDFDSDIINFLDGDVPRRPSNGVYIFLNL